MRLSKLIGTVLFQCCALPAARFGDGAISQKEKPIKKGQDGTGQQETNGRTGQTSKRVSRAAGTTSKRAGNISGREERRTNMQHEAHK